MGGAWVDIGLGWLTILNLGLVPIDLSALNANSPLGLAVAPAVSETSALPTTVTIASLVLSLGVAVLGGAATSWLVARLAAELKPAEALRE